jgi:hypothetical protein
MADERWSVLFAKNTSKKIKKWLDGTLSAKNQGARTRVIVYDDAGSVLEEVHRRMPACGCASLSSCPQP